MARSTKVFSIVYDYVRRLVQYNSAVKIHTNGIDNAYPQFVDGLFHTSVTAQCAAEIMTQYIVGKGVEFYGNLKVNSKQVLNMLSEDIAKSRVKHRGVFIHVNYNDSYEIIEAKVIPFADCRIGIIDDNNHAPKVYVSKLWGGVKGVKDDDCSIYDIFNPDTAVIQAQIDKAGSIEKYKGQIMYINFDSEFIYPLSTVHPVLEDCESEKNAKIYKSNLTKRGFFGTTVVISRPLVDKGLDKNTPEYIEMESERTEFRDGWKNVLGADNAGGLLVLETEYAGDKLEDAIFIKQIESKIDDKLFAFTESSVRENILMAFNNLPVGLIKSSDTLFGQSGTALFEMRKMYWENLEKDRNRHIEILKIILKGMKRYNESQPLEIIPLFNFNTQPNATSTLN